MSTPRPKSTGEETFQLQCRVEGLAPQREATFHHTRKWRFDFSWPTSKLAVEIEGVVWGGAGRHQRGAGMSEDCRKYAEALVLGWRVLRVTTEMVLSGEAIDYTLKALGPERARGARK